MALVMAARDPDLAAYLRAVADHHVDFLTVGTFEAEEPRDDRGDLRLGRDMDDVIVVSERGVMARGSEPTVHGAFERFAIVIWEREDR
jgi:hypothetical protein